MAVATRVAGSPALPEEMRTLRVWDLPVRISHWVVVLSIVILSVTGYYIANPFLVTHGPTGFVMGTMRFVHIAAAFVFTVAVLFRLYWAFAGNHWARWREFVPIGKRRLGLLRQQGQYYFFLRRTPPPQVGHNPLAGVTYTVIYFLFLVQILTGFALYSIPMGQGFWQGAFGWMVLMFGATTLRLVHFLVMFTFIAFTVHHVYSAVLIDIEEQSGLVSSIVTGNKTLSGEHIAAAVQGDPAGEASTHE